MEIEDGKILIDLARNSINSIFTSKKLSLADSEKFSGKQGVFVTLKLYDKLRGCIGFPTPIYPLQRAIIEAARAAAFKDPRFHPVSKEDMDDITIEISVLSVPELLEVKDSSEYLDKIEIGKHGLIIKKEWKSGLLLPQVFSEQECTPLEALGMVCEKAGLDFEDWTENAEIYTFSAEIFHEEEPGGNVAKLAN